MDPQLAPKAPQARPSKDDPPDNQINISFINCYGQSKLSTTKQLEIQSYVCSNKLDIIHLQECRIEDNIFAHCGFLISNFNIYSNNKPDGSHYGTASLVRSDLSVTNIHTDDDGRGLIFDAAKCTWGKFYLPSGSGRDAKTKREGYCGLNIPQLLVNRLAHGAAGGDFNCIISIPDSVKNPQINMSPTCRNLVKSFLWSDSYRSLHPRTTQFPDIRARMAMERPASTDPTTGASSKLPSANTIVDPSQSTSASGSRMSFQTS